MKKIEEKEFSLKNPKQQIIFEKFYNPYDNEETQEKISEWKEKLGEDEDKEQIVGQIHGIAHPLYGIVPMNEYMSPDKVFNFWWGFTNFNLTPKVCGVIERTDGIEILKILTRYRFLFGVGKYFKAGEVFSCLEKNIKKTSNTSLKILIIEERAKMAAKKDENPENPESDPENGVL